ncbi:cysteine desulfurase NifS [Candidatus Parvarchaeota archaeon]|jgi:cysteine desulfurase|nr:MAG: cysteine desulfurase NifS [Candidatus Parvarchaeota archaeon]HIG52118.1 cysteine desulfurase [Candidatus Pacearchaeota archaeon]
MIKNIIKMKREIYLDNSSTTKVYPEVFREMKPYFLKKYGNPSSLHEIGEEASKAINEARENIAKVINAKPWEIYFTSGGTESDNLAIQGLARANPKKRKIVIGSIDHAAIVSTCNYLKTKKYLVSKIPVDEKGLLDYNSLKKEINQNTLVFSTTHSNSVIGVIQDLKKIGDLCEKKGVFFHVDAAQSFGKLKIDVEEMKIDLLSGSAHKLGGPKGIGFLYVKKKTKIVPLIFGGGQEKNLRSGTENVPGIVGFSKALEISNGVNKIKMEYLRNRLMEDLEKLGGKINGSKKKRIYNNVHVSFPKVSGQSLVLFLSNKNIYVSSGSACDSKKEREDYVLKSLGLTDNEINGSIRISLNEENNEKQIKIFLKELEKILNKLRI